MPIVQKLFNSLDSHVVLTTTTTILHPYSLPGSKRPDHLPYVIRHLGVVRQKLDWIAKSMTTLERISSDIQTTKKELKQVNEPKR